MRLRDRVIEDQAPETIEGAPVRTLIGGVGYRWQRDVSVGLAASDLLTDLDWPDGVTVADLGYGAIFVTQDLADAQPPYERLVLLAGTPRDREPGQIYRHRWPGSTADPEEIQARIREAGAGVIDLDHLLIIAEHFGALPKEVILLEVEPVDSAGGEGLSPAVEQVLPELVAAARREALAPPHKAAAAPQ